MHKYLTLVLSKAYLSGKSTSGWADSAMVASSLLNEAPLARPLLLRGRGHIIGATQLHRYKTCSAAAAARATPASREPRSTACQAAWACASLGLLEPRPTAHKALHITTDSMPRTSMPQRCAMAGGCSTRTQWHTCLARGAVRAAATAAQSAQADDTVEGLTGLRKRVRGGYVLLPHWAAYRRNGV